MPALNAIAEPTAGSVATPARRGAGVYVHWPFCVSKCPYCDFNSHVRDAVDEDRWGDALVSEINAYAARMPDLAITSVFFGGGTPSLMAPRSVARILAAVDAAFGFATEPEITIEANPSTVEVGKFAGFRAAGINRLSIGVQSLRPDSLKFLGRTHSVETARAAVVAAMSVFKRVSVDLIYGLPGQTARSWSDELDEALDLGSGHVSAYQLTIEPGTRFHRDVARGRWTPAADDTAAELYEITEALCARAGLFPYEISNYARPNAHCRHNLIYWRSRPYLGIGPGAHGRLPRNGSPAKTAQVNIRSPEKWLAAVEKSGLGLASNQPVSARDRAEEIFIMGLRLTDGLALTEIDRQTGLHWREVVSEEAIGELSENGWVERSGARLRLRPAGRLLLDSILGDLLT